MADSSLLQGKVERGAKALGPHAPPELVAPPEGADALAAPLGSSAPLGPSSVSRSGATPPAAPARWAAQPVGEPPRLAQGSSSVSRSGATPHAHSDAADAPHLRVMVISASMYPRLPLDYC